MSKELLCIPLLMVGNAWMTALEILKNSHAITYSDIGSGIFLLKAAAQPSAHKIICDQCPCAGVRAQPTDDFIAIDSRPTVTSTKFE